MSTQNNFNITLFKNIKTLSTMMKNLHYSHSKIVLEIKNNLNFRIYTIRQLNLFLLSNKIFIKNYNSQTTEKKVQNQNLGCRVINLKPEIFLCLKDNCLIQVKIFIKIKIRIFKIELLILELKKLFMMLSHKKLMFLMVCFTEANIVGRVNQLIKLLLMADKINQSLIFLAKK